MGWAGSGEINNEFGNENQEPNLNSNPLMIR